ncbi:hypothetical protein ZWY2020_022066 [Hordeum vulgare]|nr:hypothetical protein ZWY2020_022066 [Hordeum vulgare]
MPSARLPGRAPLRLHAVCTPAGSTSASCGPRCRLPLCLRSSSIRLVRVRPRASLPPWPAPASGSAAGLPRPALACPPALLVDSASSVRPSRRLARRCSR